MELAENTVSETALNSFAQFNRNAFAVAIKDKVGGSTLRDLSPQAEVSIATLSRAINQHSISLGSVLKICTWLQRNVNEFIQQPSVADK